MAPTPRMSDDERTLEPTPHKRQLARERGQIAHSQELASAALLLGSLALVAFAGRELVDFLADVMRGSISGKAWLGQVDSSRVDGATIAGQWQGLVGPLARVLLPLLGGMMLVAFGGHFLQIGPVFRPGRLAPDSSRVDPMAGLSRIRERASVARWMMSLLRLTAVLGVAGLGLWNRREQIAELAAFDLPHMAESAWQILLTLCWQAGGTLAGLAVVDYLFERWRLERALRMTPQEIREETREMRGDPQVAARRAAMRVGS